MRRRPPHFGRRRRFLEVLSLFAFAFCVGACADRERPSPVDPGAGMTVDVTSPDDGESVRPGPLDVTIHAHDAVGRLDGLGVAVRTAPAPGNFVDSQVVHFSARTDTTLTIRVQIPKVNNPVGMELRAFALNATGGVTRTGARALIVIPCPSTGCPTTTSSVLPSPGAQVTPDWIHVAVNASRVACGLHLEGAGSPARRPPLSWRRTRWCWITDSRNAPATGGWWGRGRSGQFVVTAAIAPIRRRPRIDSRRSTRTTRGSISGA